MSSYAPLQLAMYRQAIALLKASPAFYADAGTPPDLVRKKALLRLDEPVTDKGDKDRGFAGDTPEACLRYGPATLPGWSAVARYGFGRGGTTPATGVAKSLTQGFELTLTAGTINAAKNDPLVAAALDALAAQGPSMGLAPGVVPYAMLGEVTVDRPQTGTGIQRPVSGEPDPRARQQVVIRFDVTAKWYGDPTPRQTIP